MVYTRGLGPRAARRGGSIPLSGTIYQRIMNIYFAGSIRGGRNDREIYSQVISLLSNYGVVLTEHLGQDGLSALGETMASEAIYKRDVKWLEEAEIVVAEVSTPSLGVGYEIAKAEAIGKKIICLYRLDSDKRLSAMIDGNKHVTVIKYQSVSDLKEKLVSILGN